MAFYLSYMIWRKKTTEIFLKQMVSRKSGLCRLFFTNETGIGRDSINLTVRVWCSKILINFEVSMYLYAFVFYRLNQLLQHKRNPEIGKLMVLRKTVSISFLLFLSGNSIFIWKKKLFDEIRSPCSRHLC